jgi:metal-responsive CopG/Arc/MetJ family transcriptional regulator
MKKRSTKTHTIDDELYERFEKIIKEEKINKSRLIEDFIERYVVEKEKEKNTKKII